MRFETWRVLREEGMRSVAWLVLSLMGWSFIYTARDPPVIDAKATKALVGLTTLLLAGVTAGLRLVTAWELKGATESQGVLKSLGGSAVAGFVVLYAILVRGLQPWIFVAYLGGVASLVGLQYWRLERSARG